MHEDLLQQIDTYKAPERAKILVDTAPPTLLVGISGAGKDTTKNELLKSGDFSDIVSHTTRSPRTNNGELEQDGVAYYFINATTAAQMVAAHDFIEVKRVHGNSQELGDVYGTSIGELEKALAAGKLAVTDLDVQGVREYKRLSERTVAIFILPPDYDTWRERLRKRYADDLMFEAEWPKRSHTAIAELKEALMVPYYHFIINQEIGRTAEVASEIAHRGDVFKRGDDEARLAARDLLQSIEAHGHLIA